jgi:hypothetical protein
MSRHYQNARAVLPDCEHQITERASWEAARTAWVAEHPDRRYEYQYAQEQPAPRDGLCADCARAWWQESPWRPELWRYLDATAANGYKSGRLLQFDKPGKLPPAPKPRDDRQGPKMYARILDALQVDQALQPREHGMLGKTIGPNQDKRWYTIAATNGHTALIDPVTPAAGQAKQWPSISTHGKEWIDLPAAFHLALKRVRLLSNERSSAIKCSYDGFGPYLTLEASCPEYGTARETVPVETSWVSDLIHNTGFVCTLSAGYLDLVCGIWPLRWYLSPPEERSSPADRYSKARTWTEELPQHFQPAGCEWHFVIMPMRT